MKAKYLNVNMVPSVLSEWEFSHQIYQPGQGRETGAR